jgi:hypothetical protein
MAKKGDESVYIIVFSSEAEGLRARAEVERVRTSKEVSRLLPLDTSNVVAKLRMMSHYWKLELTPLDKATAPIPPGLRSLYFAKVGKVYQKRKAFSKADSVATLAPKVSTKRDSSKSANRAVGEEAMSPVFTLPAGQLLCLVLNTYRDFSSVSLICACFCF